MRNFLLLIIGIIILLGAALFIVPGLVPSEVYQEKIETQLSKELGRDVTIGGDVELKSFPFIRARTSDVTVKNYAGFTEKDFIKIQALEAKIKLLPLLSKRVEITGFSLNKPEIYLERKANGKTNWSDPQSATDQSLSDASTTPFQRDGRFTNFDPQIASFTLAQGRIKYTDAIKDQNIELSDISGSLSLPSLSSPLRIDTKLQYQNTPMEVDLQLDNVRAFLNGRQVPFTTRVISDFADIDVDGQFSHSENLEFTAKITSTFTDFEPIQSLTPQSVPYIDLLQSLKVDGNVAYENKVASIENSTLDVIGQGLSVQYQGNATFDSTPILDGTINFNVSNFDDIQPYLPKNTPSLSALDRLEGNAVFEAAANRFLASKIFTQISGDGLSATYEGEAAYSSETITATGFVKSTIDNVEKTVKLANIETPYASLLGRLNATGNVAVNNKTVKITNLDTIASEGALNGQYLGTLEFNQTPKMDGTFDIEIDDFGNVANVLALETPYGSSLQKISVAGKATSEENNILISNLLASTSEGLLDLAYDGEARYIPKASSPLQLNGNLTGEIPNVRALAALGGTQLPVSTETGEIFTLATLSGALTGSTEALYLTQATVVFDDIQGNGSMDISLTKEKPFIKTKLTLAGLDLRPYMASYSAQNPTGDIQPWSEENLNTAPLTLLDGMFNISTPNIITDRLRLGQSDITAQLSNGRLKAELPNLSLYGGSGRAEVMLDAAKPIPEFALDLTMDALEGNTFLGAVSGFTKVTGTADTNISIKGSGRSQATMMKSLTGKGQFGLSGGEIRGIDVVKFTTGLEEAFKTKALPQGIGAEQLTKFNALESLFSISNGVVSINEFDIAATGLAAKGVGQIDLGNQTIDFKLRPRLTSETASNIASYGVPLKFSGGFGSAKAGLDSQFLGDILTAKAKAEAAKRIQGQVKGPLGDILGTVIGGNTSTAPSSDTTSQSSQTTAEDEIKNVLGGLLGQTTKNANPETTPNDRDPNAPASDKKDPDDKKEEPKKSDLEKALGSLFGD